jgi:hypothetical protein
VTPSARYLVHFIFFYTCIEGLVINVSYPNKLAFVYKDAAILAVYLLVFLGHQGLSLNPSPTSRGLTGPLLLFSFAVCLYLALPEAGWMASLVAAKQRLFYIPLIGVGYLFIRSEDDFKRLSSLLALYAIGVALFGIYLYFTGPMALRGMGATYSYEFHTAGYRIGETYWRVPGTFTSPGQYGAYLLFNGLIAGALLMTKSLSKPWRAVAAVSFVLVILAILTSGSRTPLVLLSASAAALLLFSRNLKGVTIWMLAGMVALLYGINYLGSAVQDRFASIMNYENTFGRMQETYFGQLFLPKLLDNPLGSGLGIATVGARHFTPGMRFQLMESYLGILAVETGVIGLGTFLWAAVAIGRLILRLWRYLQGSPTAMLWYTLAVYVLCTILTLPIGTGIDHVPTNLYFWFSIGVLIKVADLEFRRRWSLQELETHRRESRELQPVA